MKSYSNFYIFLYASIMVVLVAAMLSFTAIKLRPLQIKNIENKKMQDILSSVNIESTADNADELYNKYITDSYIINSKGDKMEGDAYTKGDAFKVNLKKELAKELEYMNLPVYVCSPDKGGKCIIVPVRGKGLGGAIWGYIAFKDDLNTIAGTTFDHDAETPGLGDKITTKEFQLRFKDKKIFDDAGIFVSVSVVKGGKGAGDLHKVDAISGSTITCNGLDEMLKDCLVNYEIFFKNKGN